MALEGKGEALMAEAEGVLRKAGGFFGGLFGSSSDKYEDAAGIFNRAAVAFKAVKKFEQSAKAYQRAADCFSRAKGNETEAATAFTECARMHVKAGDGKTATDLLETEAVPRLVDAGRMGQAAKLYNEIADLLEAEGLTEQAIVNFEKAADMFSAENTATAAQKCMIKIGHLCASKDAPEFARAAEIFTRVATESMSNPLLKFQARGLLFEAFLCTLAQADVVAADAALSRSKDIDYTFPGSRECKLCEDILQAFKDMNGDAFTDAVFNYDQISKLDPWKTNVLLRIKMAINGGGMGGGGGGAMGGAGSGGAMGGAGGGLDIT